MMSGSLADRHCTRFSGCATRFGALSAPLIPIVSPMRPGPIHGTANGYLPASLSDCCESLVGDSPSQRRRGCHDSYRDIATVECLLLSFLSRAPC